jgi:hypothetical protein
LVSRAWPVAIGIAGRPGRDVERRHTSVLR